VNNNKRSIKTILNCNLRHFMNILSILMDNIIMKIMLKAKM